MENAYVVRGALSALTAALLVSVTGCATQQPAQSKAEGKAAPPAAVAAAPPPAATPAGAAVSAPKVEKAPAAPAIPPTWAQGRESTTMLATLSPHAPAMMALPAEQVLVDKLKLPKGFKATLWASGVANAREMTVGDKGTVFVGTRFVGSVFAIVDKNGKREVKVIAKGLHRPNGVAFKDGSLYVAELSRIIRFDKIEDNLDNPPKPVVVYDNLPKDEPHGWKFIAFGPDGKLYIPVGSPGNIVLPPDTHAQIRRINPDGSGMEVVARGVRNSVGFAWHPKTKELWFTDNGRDWLGEDVPNDELNRISKQGQHFGFPFCHQGDILDPEFGKGKNCADYVKPELKLGPHVAALGIRFYQAKMFPKEYQGNAFIAQHGSWNKSRKSGFRVMRVVFDKTGKKAVKYLPFIEGWEDNEKFWGRPADVQVLKDGSMLISDAWAGAIIRVTYDAKQK